MTKEVTVTVAVDDVERTFVFSGVKAYDVVESLAGEDVAAKRELVNAMRGGVDLAFNK